MNDLLLCLTGLVVELAAGLVELAGVMGMGGMGGMGGLLKFARAPDPLQPALVRAPPPQGLSSTMTTPTSPSLVVRAFKHL